MISVILPVYRVEKYIDACIRSVLAQNYRDFEVIIVDDGSPDNSPQIAEELLKKDGKVSYQIIHTENRGVSAARNTGIAAAKGDYLIMVDSDDVLSPTFLSEFAGMLERSPGLDIYSCGFSVVDENNWKDFAPAANRFQVFSWDEAQLSFLDRKIRFLLPTLLLRREYLLANKIVFDEAVRYSEDVQFIWRCLAYNRNTVLHSDNKLYNYILHPGSTMTASGIPKILTCCGGITRLFAEAGEKFCPAVQNQIVTRTFFSMLHGAAKMMDTADFCQLYNEANCSAYIRKQAVTGNLKARLVAFALLISKSLGYQIMRKY